MAWGRRNKATLSADEVQRAWQRGLKAATEEDWSAAETWLERIVASDTQDLDAYHALAGLYRKQGAVGRAIRMHQNLLLRTDLTKDARADCLYELGRDFESGGFGERAVATYEEFLSARPRSLVAIERMVPLLTEQRDFPRALVLVRKLRKKDTESAERSEVAILLAQAQACADEGKQDGARQALKKCLRRDKTCAPALSLLGELEAERGKSSKALDAWKRAATADAEIARGLYSKIDAGYAAKSKKKGEPEFDVFLRQILDARPNDATARIALARAMASRGETRLAIQELARGLQALPDHLELHAEFGRQLLASNQDAEALKAYADLLTRIGPDVGAEDTILGD